MKTATDLMLEMNAALSRQEALLWRTRELPKVGERWAFGYHVREDTTIHEWVCSMDVVEKIEPAPAYGEDDPNAGKPCIYLTSDFTGQHGVAIYVHIIRAAKRLDDGECAGASGIDFTTSK